MLARIHVLELVGPTMSDSAANPKVSRRLAAILAADIAGYSALMGADDVRTVRDLKGHQTIILPMIAEHGGRVIDTAGDGILAEFASVVNAVECAVVLQKTMAERNAVADPASRMQFRIGINIGDVIHDETRLYGDGVNVAARLEGIAEPGGICLSGDAHGQVHRKLPLTFIDVGEQQLKNISAPVRVYRVDMGHFAPAAPSSRPTQALPDKPSIAVLAFNNMSGEAEQEYFSDGISEDIITELSKLSELHVIARNSTFTYKGRAVDVKQVGRELSVRYVLEGSVRKSGNRVRVTGQLIDATSGAHIWAERFDRDLTDIFAVQDELTQQIISALKIRLAPEQKERLARKYTGDVEAYSLFLRGREQALIMTRSNGVEARRLLARAIEINPSLAAAHAYVALTHVADYNNGWAEVPEKSLETALEIAGHAVAMDEEDPYAHFALAVALVWKREHDRAFAEIQRCLALAPGSAEGHLAKSNIQYYMGNPLEAIETLNTYMRLDPLYPEMALYFLAQAQAALGQYEASVDTLKRRLERNPTSATSYALLASCYGHLGMLPESRAAWAELKKIDPDFSIERRRRILPFSDPRIFDDRLAGMRKAGLLEN